MRTSLRLAPILGPVLILWACGSTKSAGSAGDGGSTGPTSGPPDASMVGQLDGSPPNTGLPPLPELTNVVATLREDSVGIDFDPVDGAKDYRVYVLPSMSDVTVNGDGSLAIKNAVYRCGGERLTFDLGNGVNVATMGCFGYNYPGPLAFGPNVQCPWGVQIPANSTLGYVYVSPGAGLVPVYAVGVHPSHPEVGWRESRPKVYTTDAATRQSLIANGGRDDGIVFYVPGAAGAGTQTVYHSEPTEWNGIAEYYFGSQDLASHAMDMPAPAPAFQVLSAQAAGTQPLMAVLYQPGPDHTELAVGKERFNRASNQGDGPLWHVEWSGLTQPTTLVVEALASGCPFEGLVSPQSMNAANHQPYYTLAQLQSMSSTGEVYVNGQYDLPGTVDGGPSDLQTPNGSPIPIARSFIQVAPAPHDPAQWDWYEGFSPGSDLGTITPVSGCMENGGPGFNCVHMQSPKFDISGYRLDEENGTPVFTYGAMLGQLWTIFDDGGGDVTGKIRFTPVQKANIDSDSGKYLHVTWSVTSSGSDRRYPQLIISNEPAPVQAGLVDPNNYTLLLQTITGPSMRFEAQAIHGLVGGMQWDVNNQAPHHSIVDYDNWADNSSATTIPPAEPLFEHTGVDRMTKFDAYVSSGRVYAFVDDTPAGCMQLPSAFTLSGAVTLTFGDVLYHEIGAENVCIGTGPSSLVRPYGYMHEHLCRETERHWDDLGFKNGVAPPAWDETRFPCEPF